MSSTQTCDTKASWASWLPFQCMPLPFSGKNQIPSTKIVATAIQDDSQHTGICSDEQGQMADATRRVVNALIYDEPLQHPRPTTAPEMTSYQSAFPEMPAGVRAKLSKKRGKSVSSAPISRVPLTPHIAKLQNIDFGSAEIPMGESTTTVPLKTYRPTISAPTDFRHVGAKSVMAEIPSSQAETLATNGPRRQISLRKSKFTSDSTNRDDSLSGNNRLKHQRSLPSLAFHSTQRSNFETLDNSLSTFCGHDIPPPVVKRVPESLASNAEITSTGSSSEKAMSCGITRSRSVPTVRKHHTAAASSHMPLPPNIPQFERQKIMEVPVSPPPPLPLILLQHSDEGKSASILPGWLSSSTKNPMDLITNSPRAITANDGFYQPVSIDRLFDRHSNCSLDSATTWNTEDMYGIQPKLLPNGKVVMGKVQHGIPKLISAEGIHGLSPPVRTRRVISK